MKAELACSSVTGPVFTVSSSSGVAVAPPDRMVVQSRRATTYLL